LGFRFLIIGFEKFNRVYQIGFNEIQDPDTLDIERLRRRKIKKGFNQLLLINFSSKFQRFEFKFKF